MGQAAGGLRYASAAGRWVLLATVLGSGLAAIDATVVGIALPAIGTDFHAGLADLQWVVTGYTLTLAGLLLVAGGLGDGRRLHCGLDAPPLQHGDRAPESGAQRA